MTHRFAELMFTPEVQAVQQSMGSRASYARLVESGAAGNDRLGATERDFISTRDSLYMATVSETGWPYVQHRGGPPGFLKILDENRIGFADFRVNRQYITVGNLAGNDRVCLFLMDYPHRRRLKLIGRARAVDIAGEHELLEPLQSGCSAAVERGLIVQIEGFDWNCQQHIVPRFSELELEEALVPFREKMRALEAEVETLRARP